MILLSECATQRYMLSLLLVHIEVMIVSTDW